VRAIVISVIATLEAQDRKRVHELKISLISRGFVADQSRISVDPVLR